MANGSSPRTDSKSHRPLYEDITLFINELRETAGRSPEKIAKQLNQMADNLEQDLSSDKITH